MSYTNEKIIKKGRSYFAADFEVTNWEAVKKQFELLLTEEIHSRDELISFMEKSGELHDIIEEENAWRYINMTRFADNEEYSKKFNEFYAKVVSKSNEYSFKINKKFYENPYRKELSDKYNHLNRIISNEIELFREENIPLSVQEMELANKYGALYSKLAVKYEGEEKTLSQLGIYLQNKDRSVREDVWKLRTQKMLSVKDEFNKIFDEMKEIRIQQAKNCRFDNYRDYMHQKKGRFSYTPQDLLEFHKAVETEVLPLLKKFNAERKDKLGVGKLRPWDIQVETDGEQLKPFDNVDELLEKSIEILYEVKPEFGLRLNKMKNSGFLDLENRKGKAPGGYNYPLQETGAPFIFMNAIGIHRNMVTLMHESGHAMHTFAMNNVKLDPYKDTPSEVAELASMSLEFISMEKWDKFYPNKEDLKKAKRKQLEGALSFLPWCMIVDAFQHWIYTNPNHTPAEREEYFAQLIDRFSTGIDWTGLEEAKKNQWQFQLHIFEMPFYYIEYGMSQLGALSVYRNYKKSGKGKTLEAYEKFLSLGYTKSVSELYEAAGIKFDFSADYIRELVKFVSEELDKL